MSFVGTELAAAWSTPGSTVASVSALVSLGWCQTSVQPVVDVQCCSSFVSCQPTYPGAAWDGGRVSAGLCVPVFRRALSVHPHVHTHA